MMAFRRLFARRAGRGAVELELDSEQLLTGYGENLPVLPGPLLPEEPMRNTPAPGFVIARVDPDEHGDLELVIPCAAPIYRELERGVSVARLQLVRREGGRHDLILTRSE